MCGINGIFAYAPAANAVDRAELLRVRDTMIERGPDGAGVWIGDDGRIGLGHRRLAILDLSAAGAQPMHSADGTLVVSFNGEIYNYPELRGELERAGVEFRSHSDTEVLLHLYRRHGPAMVGRLRGMFAFALWDRTRKTLFTTRDHRGRQCRSLLASANWRIVPRTDPRTLVFSLLRLANRLHRAIGMARSGRMDAGMWFSMWALVDQCLRARGQSPATAPCR